MARSERSFRTPAIILKRRDFGEADRLLTLLTPTRGKIDVLAKGVRKLTSAKMGHVELFTRSEMLINTGRELGLVVQAECTHPYIPLREDLTRGAYAAYAAELLDKFTENTEEESNKLFFLLDQTLVRLSEHADVRLVIRYYELHLLDFVGFRPDLNYCAISGQDIKPEDQYFSPEAGGVVSPSFVHQASGVFPLSLATLKVLRHLQRSAFEDVQALNISPALHDDVERILMHNITYILERRLQSVDFIRHLRQS